METSNTKKKSGLHENDAAPGSVAPRWAAELTIGLAQRYGAGPVWGEE
jgi:hypothetical protein